jgi:hypothetical protein
VHGNLHAPFGKRTTEKDQRHRHLAGAPLHSEGGMRKRNACKGINAPHPDPTHPR